MFWGGGWFCLFFCAAKKLWFVSFLFTLTVLSCIVSLSVLLFYEHFYNILFYCLNFKSWSRWLSGDMMSSLIYWKCPVQFFSNSVFMIFFIFSFFLSFLFFPSWSHPAKMVYLPQVYWTKQNGSHFHNTSQRDSFFCWEPQRNGQCKRQLGASVLVNRAWSLQLHWGKIVESKALAPFWS